LGCWAMGIVATATPPGTATATLSSGDFVVMNESEERHRLRDRRVSIASSCSLVIKSARAAGMMCLPSWFDRCFFGNCKTERNRISQRCFQTMLLRSFRVYLARSYSIFYVWVFVE
jgi:hypothetical protein